MQNASPNISAEDDHPSVTRYRSASHNSLSPAMPRTYAQTTRSRFPLFIDPKMEVKIADFGNSCWEVSNFFFEVERKLVSYTFFLVLSLFI